MRDVSKPMATLNWEMNMKEGKMNPMMYACKFVPNTDLILAGARDDKAAKCFNAKTGNIVKEFPVQDDCYAVDISKNGTLTVFGDGNGWIHMENINYQRILDE